MRVEIETTDWPRRGELGPRSAYLNAARVGAGVLSAEVVVAKVLGPGRSSRCIDDCHGQTCVVDAVGASCAVPGLWPPVTIGDRRFMDGGMRTVANADLAHGYERVVIVAPVAVGMGFMASPRRQAAALTAAGARVALVRPDRTAVRAIGRNVLDVSRRAAAARAGLAQAAAEAPAVRAVWQA